MTITGKAQSYKNNSYMPFIWQARWSRAMETQVYCHQVALCGSRRA